MLSCCSFNRCFSAPTIGLLVAGACVFVAGTPTAFGGNGDEPVYEVHRNMPDFDRWMYQFNATPGFRSTAPVFGALGTDAYNFDEHDGQFLIGFETDPDPEIPGAPVGGIPAGEGAERYQIVSCTVTIATASNNFFYDPTHDSYQTGLLPVQIEDPQNPGETILYSDPDFEEDEDLGSPVILVGMGYRNGWSISNFVESSPFATGAPPFTYKNVRNAFPTDYADSTVVDITNHTYGVDGPFGADDEGGWEVAPFAIGKNENLTAGDLVPTETDLTFEFDLSNPDVVAYLQASLDAGRLRFSILSYAFGASSSNPDNPNPGGALRYPSFHTRDSKFAAILDLAPRMDLVVRISDPVLCPWDIAGGNGYVDAEDLANLLNAWGEVGGPADQTGDPGVDAQDLANLLNAWGECPGA